MGREHLAFFISVLLIAGIPLSAFAENVNQDEVLNVPSRAGNHDEIDIDGHIELLDRVIIEGWSGNGSEMNPYLIEGFVFENLSNAIKLKDITLHVKIINCTITYCRSSIEVNYCTNITIENCQIDGDYLEIDGSRNIRILDSKINGGTRIENSENIQIVNCTKIETVSLVNIWNTYNISIIESKFFDIMFGADIYFSGDLTIRNCSFSNITEQCFFLTGTHNVRIEGSTFTNITRDVLDVAGPIDNLTIVTSHFEKVGNDGIDINGDNSRIVNNTFKNMNTGIRLGNVMNMEMHNNKFENSGIYIQYFYENILQSNISDNNTIDGKPILLVSDMDYGDLEFSSDFSMLMLSNVSNTRIRNRVLDHPGTGLLLNKCENIDIDSNSFVGMHNAIMVEKNNEIQIMDNLVSGSISRAVDVDGCSNVTISGNNLTGSINDGIDVRRSNYVTIQDNTISELRYAVYLIENENQMITDNHMMNCEYGIQAQSNEASRITSNQIINCSIGTYSRSNKELLINENVIEDCIWGIRVIDSYLIENKVWIVDNNIRSNKGDGIIIDRNVEAELYSNIMEFSGIRVLSISNEIIIPENNTINEEEVLFIDGQSQYDVDTDEFSQLIILDSDNITIKDIAMKNVSSPVQILGSESISLKDVIIENSITGMYISSVIDMEMKNISICECTEYGISIRDSSKVHLNRSNIWNVVHGITGVYIYDILIEGVNITDCSYGFELFDSGANVTIRSNTLRNMEEAGIEVHRTYTYGVMISDNMIINCSIGIFQKLFCRELKILRNLFVENRDYAIMFDEDHERETVFIHSNLFFYNNGSGDTFDPFYKQVYCEDDGVRWYWDRMGNYWSDWTGPDDNNNGIVDVPFVIGEGIIDSYPLTVPPFELVFPPDHVFGKTGNGFVNLSWSEAKKDLIGNDTSIVVYRQYGFLDFEELAVVPPGTVHFNDTDVVNGGVYRYHLTARSSLGESYPTKDILFVPDGLPPELAIIEPLNGTYHNSSTITVKWLANDPHTGLGEVLLKMDDGIWFNVMEDDHFNFSLLMDGVHIIYMKAKDRTGNEIDISSQFFVDTTPPTINISSSTGKNITNGNEFEIEWNCTDLLVGMDHCKLSIDDGTRSIVFWEGSFDVKDLDHGSHHITIEALDLLGNNISRDYHFFVDKESPILSIIQPAEGGYINDPSIHLEWEHWDNDTGISAIVGTINGVEKWNVSWQTTSMDLTLDEGENMIVITAYDGVGNHISKTLLMTLDTVAPTVIEKSPEGINVNISEEVIVTFSERISGFAMIIDCDFEYTTNWYENTFIMKPSKQLDKGENYSISITAFDLAGNEIKVSWTFKTEEPEPEIVDEPNEKEDPNYLPLILISILVLIILFGIVVFVRLRREEEETIEDLPMEHHEE